MILSHSRTLGDLRQRNHFFLNYVPLLPFFVRLVSHVPDETDKQAFSVFVYSSRYGLFQILVTS